MRRHLPFVRAAVAVLCLGLVAPVRAGAAPGDETLIAGGSRGGDGGPAMLAGLRNPYGLVIEPSGDVLIADLHHEGIRRFDPAAGTIDLELGGTRPYGIARGADGSIYWSEFTFQFGGGFPLGNISGFFPANVKHRHPSGVVETMIGTGHCGSTPDGVLAGGAEACPTAVAMSPAGRVTFVERERVRIVAEDGTIRTVAGTGERGGAGDGGPAIDAQLAGPAGIAYDAAGALYIADTGNGRIRRVDPSGTISSVAGPDLFPVLKGTPELTQGLVDLAAPVGIATDAAGDVFFADRATDRLRKLNVVTGLVTTMARIPSPVGVAWSEGALYVSSEKVWTRNPQGHVRTEAFLHRVGLPVGPASVVAGSGNCCYGVDGAPAVHNEIGWMGGAALGPDGSLWFTDLEHDLVRRIDAGGSLETLAGNDSERNAPPAPFDALLPVGETRRLSGLGEPSSIAVGDDGTVYVLESVDGWILAIDPVTTIARALVQVPEADVVAVAAGNVFVAATTYDYESGTPRARLWRIDASADGGLAAVAGNGSCGTVPDGVSALDAPLCSIGSIVGYGGGLALGDWWSNRVYGLGTDGSITTIAGNGSGVPSGDGGPARDAGLPAPASLGVDGAGSLYVGSLSGPIRRIGADGTIDTVLDRMTNRLVVAPDGSLLVTEDSIYYSVDHAYPVGRITRVQGPLP